MLISTGFFTDAACGVKTSTCRKIGGPGGLLASVFSSPNPERGVYKAGHSDLKVTTVTLRCTNAVDLVGEVSYNLTWVVYCTISSKVTFNSWTVDANGNPESTWDTEGPDIIIFHWGSSDTPPSSPYFLQSEESAQTGGNTSGLEVTQEAGSSSKRRRT